MKESKRTVATDVFQMTMHIENVHSGAFPTTDKRKYILSVLDKIESLGENGLISFDIDRINRFKNLYSEQ